MLPLRQELLEKYARIASKNPKCDQSSPWKRSRSACLGPVTHGLNVLALPSMHFTCIGIFPVEKSWEVAVLV